MSACHFPVRTHATEGFKSTQRLNETLTVEGRNGRSVRGVCVYASDNTAVLNLDRANT